LLNGKDLKKKERRQGFKLRRKQQKLKQLASLLRKQMFYESKKSKKLRLRGLPLKKPKPFISRKSRRLRLLVSPQRKLLQRLRKSVLKLRKPRRLASLQKKPRLKPRDSNKRLQREHVKQRTKKKGRRQG